MASLATDNDQQNRLRLMLCCLGTKGSELATKLKYGINTSCATNNLGLLVAYWDVLECYKPSVTTNCLTQTQVDKIWDHVASLCGICFAPYGSTYVTAQNDERITEGQEPRITEEGDQRVVE